MTSLHFASRSFLALVCACIVPCQAQEPAYTFAGPDPTADPQLNWFEPSPLVPPSEESSEITLLDDLQHSPTTASTEAGTRQSVPPAVPGPSLENPDFYGVTQFLRHFGPYEPMYFVGGAQSPNIKFQLSVKYQIYKPGDGAKHLTTAQKFGQGFNVAYSQTSLWDVSDPSEPFFFDSSYRPELFYEVDHLPKGWLPKDWDFNIQAGLGHESNGQKIPDHRSMNVAFIHPTLRIGQLLRDSSKDYFVTFTPRFYGYINDISQNPDIEKYRGYCDLRIVLGEEGGLQLSTIARVGSEFNRASAQFDITYPIAGLINDKNIDLCLDLQYFIGYGDTLLTYNQRNSFLRFGFSLYRY
jgi:phospholipase A1